MQIFYPRNIILSGYEVLPESFPALVPFLCRKRAAGTFFPFVPLMAR